MSKKLSTLGVGTTFEVPVKSAYRSFLGDYVVFKMADKNHSGYPSGATRSPRLAVHGKSNRI